MENNLTVQVEEPGGGWVQINTLDISPGKPGIPKQAFPWTGLNSPEIPLVLVARPYDGYQFSHWEGDETSDSDTLSFYLTSNKQVKAVFLPVGGNQQIVHYWHFNNLPSGALSQVFADSSI